MRSTGTDFDVLSGDEERDLNDGFRKVECHERESVFGSSDCVKGYVFGLSRSFLKSVDVGQSSDVISGVGSSGGLGGERPFFRKGSCIFGSSTILETVTAKQRGVEGYDGTSGRGGNGLPLRESGM